MTVTVTVTVTGEVPAMKLRFWGVRGSIPAPGPETNRYGGNTSCVSVHTAAGGLVIIDMGTGLMHLGNALMAGEFGKGQGRAGILLSHTHWDHIQGLGFFAPVFIAGNQFTVWGPGGSPEVLEEILEGQMDPELLAAPDPAQLLRRVRRQGRDRRVRGHGAPRPRAPPPARRDHRARVPPRGSRQGRSSTRATSATSTAT